MIKAKDVFTEIHHAFLFAWISKAFLEEVGEDRGEAVIFHDANLTILNYLAIGYKKAVKPGPKAVMPWDYHVGHLFTTLEKVIIQELSEEGQKAIDIGLAKFSERFGEQALQEVLTSRSMDYSILPGD